MTVRDICQKVGLSMEVLYQQYSSGMSQRKIARAYGISQDAIKKRMAKFGIVARRNGTPTVHGHCSRSSPRRTREYRSWEAMKNRCLNPKYFRYKDHGGRGISICSSWMDSFACFLADMGPRPIGKSLDRINNDGNYEPSNCRWATAKEQCANRRRKSNG